MHMMDGGKTTGVLQLKVKIKLHAVVIAKNYSVCHKYTANYKS